MKIDPLKGIRTKVANLKLKFAKLKSSKLFRPTPKQTLEEHLIEIQEKIKSEENISVESLFHSLAGRGYPFMIVLLSLPFCQPLQIPGMSTPFGLMISFIGLRMAFSHRLWWPQAVLRQEISSIVLQKVISKSLWLIRKLKKILHPRWTWLCGNSYFTIAHGIMITLLGIFLALPLPIPLSNILAAWALLLIGLGLLEDDGLFVSLGYVLAFFCIGMFGLIVASLHYLTTKVGFF